jgi:hypothetical protein
MIYLEVKTSFIRIKHIFLFILYPHSTPHIYGNFNYLIEAGINQGITTSGL